MTVREVLELCIIHNACSEGIEYLKSLDQDLAADIAWNECDNIEYMLWWISADRKNVKYKECLRNIGLLFSDRIPEAYVNALRLPVAHINRKQRIVEYLNSIDHRFIIEKPDYEKLLIAICFYCVEYTYSIPSWEKLTKEDYDLVLQVIRIHYTKLP